MKLGLLAVLLCGALVAPSALRSDSSEDPFEERLDEIVHGVEEAKAKLRHAIERRNETGDLDAFAAAREEFGATLDRLTPSKLDVWEARQRLVELVYDVDDETAFELYMIARERMQDNEKAMEELAELRARMDRTAQNQASRGVSLTPESLPPDD